MARKAEQRGYKTHSDRVLPDLVLDGTGNDDTVHDSALNVDCTQRAQQATPASIRADSEQLIARCFCGFVGYGSARKYTASHALINSATKTKARTNAARKTGKRRCVGGAEHKRHNGHSRPHKPTHANEGKLLSKISKQMVWGKVKNRQKMTRAHRRI